jgi:hypothetical protein
VNGWFAASPLKAAGYRLARWRKLQANGLPLRQKSPVHGEMIIQ